MGRKPNTTLTNIATTYSPNNLTWKNAKHACSSQKNLMYPPLSAKIKHDLQCWLESEVRIGRKTEIKIPEPKNWAIQKERETTTTQQTKSSVDLEIH